MLVFTWLVLLCGSLFVKGATPSANSVAGFDPLSLLNIDLVKKINAFITLDSLVTNLIRCVYFPRPSTVHAHKRNVLLILALTLMVWLVTSRVVLCIDIYLFLIML